ncbi:FitA-like ribbon-helix-helix domain-containing protein [Cupriavidus pinatubonensis]
MATQTIRNVDDELKARLRIEAAQHGHSRDRRDAGLSLDG